MNEKQNSPSSRRTFLKTATGAAAAVAA
ncbi:MAG: twin-arginine translocation signal domain-containing protein, partial [Verrucomicrobia bacterium]|nr:twin-arginine translocation signal domain-containing protein [Verrucomicrobiota bacterium]